MVRPIALTTAYLASSVVRSSQPFVTYRAYQQHKLDRTRSVTTVVASFVAATATISCRNTTGSTTHTDALELTQSTKRAVHMMSTTRSNTHHLNEYDTDENKTTPGRETIQTGYLNAADAAALDEELMSTPGYTLEQLMELAGLAVAEAVYQVIPSLSAAAAANDECRDHPISILVICGPGNNGGDGLVAARHLYMFGFTNIMIVYPALHKVKNSHYINLVKQCQDLGISVSDAMPNDWSSQYSIIVDAIFGFSFRGDPRPPYDAILDQLKRLNGNTNVTTVAVDIPSGWNVDGEDVRDGADRFMPNVLVSLTVPKLCAQTYAGRHFVGGRFLPPILAQKYNISMPPYPGVAQVMEITSDANILIASAPIAKDDRSWEVEYANFLAEKERDRDSVANQQTNENESTWEEQYAMYCAEKEEKLQHFEEHQQRND